MEPKKAPVGTKCPINPEKTLSREGKEIEFTIPLGNKKPITVECFECGKMHYRSDFKKDPIMLELFDHNSQVKIYKRIEKNLDPKPVSSIPKEYESNITSVDNMLSLSRLADGVRKAINDYVDAFDKKIKNNTKDVKSKKFSEADRDRIFKNYYGADAMEGKCILCPNIIKNTGSGFEVSHIHPKMYGGGNEYDNLMPLCSKCNRDMGSNHYYSYLWKKYGKLHDKWDIIKV